MQEAHILSPPHNVELAALKALLLYCQCPLAKGRAYAGKQCFLAHSSEAAT